MAFDQKTRNLLQRFVADSRSLLADEFTRQLQATYGMNPKTGEVANIQTLSGLTPNQQETAHLLRDTLAHYLANAEKGKEKTRNVAAIERIVREQAFTVLNRLAALRMSEARGFLNESLAKSYDSKGFQLFRRVTGNSLGETGDAYRHYLFSLFDEFSLDLSVLFDRFSVQGRLFPSSPILLKLLGLINDECIAPLWAEDETIGWIYQYFNTQEERKKMREQSQAPRNSRELAVRNQFFTPRYVVEFLADNTLGRIWYEMTQGKTGLTQSCKYLVRRPNERFLAPDEIAPEPEENLELSQEELLQQTVYIQHRALKDPRDIRMLDPACGSMHFGLYAFDLFEAIYSEAWDIEATQGTAVFTREHDKTPITSEYKDKSEFLVDVPRLIIENNIHGVDIDPRAVQIAGLSLWLRVHNSWQQAGIKPQSRPKIQRSNIVCAEPMPGEKALLQEFTAALKPTVLGQLVEVIFEKMELAGEAGTLLKIEQEIQNAIAEAKALWRQQNQALSLFPDLAKIAKQRGEIEFDVSDIDDEGFWEQAEQKILTALADYAQQAATDESGQKRLFTDDAAKGFAFIELCRKRFDVVLMNPPFGEAAHNVSDYLIRAFGDLSRNLIVQFIQRAKEQTRKYNGSIGVVLDRTVLIKNSYENFRRRELLDDNSVSHVLDLGWGVLDANVEVSSIILSNYLGENVLGIDATQALDKSKEIHENLTNFSIVPSKKIKKFPNAAINLSMPSFFIDAILTMNSLEELGVKFVNGHTIKSDVFKRLSWEVKKEYLNIGNAKPMWNGSSYSPFRVSFVEAVLVEGYGGGLANHKSTIFRSREKHLLPGLCYGKRGDYLDVQELPHGFVLTNEGFGAPVKPKYIKSTSCYLNSSLGQYFINLYCGQHKGVGYVNQLPFPNLKGNEFKIIEDIFDAAYSAAKNIQSLCETDHEFLSPLTKNWQEGSPVDLLFNYIKLNNNEYCSALYRNDQNIYDIFHLSSEQRKYIDTCIVEQRTIPRLYYGVDITDENALKTAIVNAIFSYLLGICFSRWDFGLNKEFIQKEKNEILALECDSKNELSCAINNSAKILCSGDFNLLIENLNLYNKSTFYDYFSKPSLFFEFHLNCYSKGNRVAPIYWPLQTPSGSYTVWVYYHSLDEQTLFTCVNDFVEVKLDSINKDLTTLRNKPSRIKDEEKEFGRLTDLQVELEDFRDELLRIAKFWKPNLNDGVQITAAPLWRLFQHKAWQKKLKETWEKLEEGDYDWAHLAYSIWPARVLRKCHHDRSLAIAHEVENELWHEVEVTKGRNRNPVWEWQPKPLSDTELNAYIQAKIQAMGHLNEH